MKVSKLTPDPLRDPPKGQGDYQCPGPFMVIPARAYGDQRFNDHPMAFRCLAICCSHTNKHTSIFYINQTTIGKVLGISKQAVSQHMGKLLKWDYIIKIRNADTRRKYGQKGAMWRVIYDERITIEDQVARSTDIDDNQVVETLNKITPIKELKPLTDKQIQMADDIAYKYVRDDTQYLDHKQVAKDIKLWLQGDQSNHSWKAIGNGLKSPFDAKYLFKNNRVKPSLDKPVDNSSKVKVQLDQTRQKVKPKLDINYSTLTNSTVSMNLKRSLCNVYSNVVNSIYGKSWTYNESQVETAGKLLEAGYTLESFKEEATRIVRYKADNNKQPPHSLVYFYLKHTNKDKPKDTKDLIKMAGANLKL